jgi:hypothetical protein
MPEQKKRIPDNVTPLELALPSQLSFLAPIAYDDLIRIGSENDGGYVIPRVIVEKAEFLLSFGISDDWHFDAGFSALNPTVKIHAYDPTISNFQYRDALALSILKLVLGGKATIGEVRERFHIFRQYRRFFQGRVQHFEERISKYKIGRSDTTIETVFGRAVSESLFLKIDIEGAEYRVIEDLLRHSDRIMGMVIEFHDTDALRSIFVDSVQRITRLFEIVHLHANNFGSVSADEVPDMLEIAFLRRNLCRLSKKRWRLPLESLDAANDPKRRDYILNFAIVV